MEVKMKSLILIFISIYMINSQDLKDIKNIDRNTKLSDFQKLELENIDLKVLDDINKVFFIFYYCVVMKYANNTTLVIKTPKNAYTKDFSHYIP